MVEENNSCDSLAAERSMHNESALSLRGVNVLKHNEAGAATAARGKQRPHRRKLPLQQSSNSAEKRSGRVISGMVSGRTMLLITAGTANFEYAAYDAATSGRRRQDWRN
jgi:hypothetical protein